MTRSTTRCHRPIHTCARLDPRRWLLFAGLLYTAGLVATSAVAPALAEPSPPSVTLHLRDASVLHGLLLEETDEAFVIETQSLGRITVPRAEVVSVVHSDATPSDLVASRDQAIGRRSGDPDINSVMFGPTPETIPGGSAYFRNFQLVILNFGYGLRQDLSLSLGLLFPVTADFQMLSLGFKYRLLSRDHFPLGLAVAANGAVVSDESLATLSGIVGVGDNRRSLNFSLHKPFINNSGSDPVFFILGADLQVGGGFKFLAEYANSGSAILSDEDFAGFVNLGFRIFGERSSFTLTGFRPIEVDSDAFIAVPFAMYSRHW